MTQTELSKATGITQTQTEKAKAIGMKQPNFSKWKKRIATDLESCIKGEARRVMQSEGYTIKLVKVRKCKK